MRVSAVVASSRCVTPENTPPQALKRTANFPACLSGARAFAGVRSTSKVQSTQNTNLANLDLCSQWPLSCISFAIFLSPFHGKWLRRYHQKVRNKPAFSHYIFL